MNKSKLSVSQTKSKPKISIPSASSFKSPLKTKDKSARASPKANRLHTLEVKKSMDIPRKSKQNLPMSPALQERSLNTGEQGKGYETPKFKWQLQANHSPKRPTVPHNFFSFGQKQNEKQKLRPVSSKPTDQQRSPAPRMRETRGLMRKQNAMR